MRKILFLLGILLQVSLYNPSCAQSTKRLPRSIKVDKDKDQCFSKGTELLLSFPIKYKLTFDASGDLAVLENDQKIWSSGTGNQGAEQFVIQKDGNLLVRKADGQILWTSNSALLGADRINVDGGILIAQARKGQSVWRTDREIKILANVQNRTSQFWYPDQIILQSIHGKYQLFIEKNQLKVKDKNGLVYWSSPESSEEAHHVHFSREGDLGIYKKVESLPENLIWHTNTANQGVHSLFLADDGYLSLSAPGAKTVWTTRAVQYDKYFTFGNVNTGHKVNIESGSLAQSEIAPGWHSAQWIFEPIPKTNYVRIKNRWKGTYLHLENGPEVQCSEIQPGWHSAQWLINPGPGGGHIIKNRWKNTYLMVDPQSGKLKCIDTSIRQAENGRWLFEIMEE